MACPYHRQVDQTTTVAILNGYCDGEELWRLRVPTPVEESLYCNSESYIECPILSRKPRSHASALTGGGHLRQSC